MNQHERTLNLLRNHLDLTPTQQLEVIKHSAARQRERARTARRISGVGALCAATYIVTIISPGLALGAVILGVAGAAFWTWNGGFDSTGQFNSSSAETRTIQEIDERLANVEAILSYEEKVAVRRNESNGSEIPNPRATQRLGIN